MDLVDLHTHTTASDGSTSPGELVALAKKAGLKALAVTDHDTVAGLDEALAAGAGLGVEVVPGVEISLEAGLGGGMHLLGLFLDHTEPRLAAALNWLQGARQRRNRAMVARLAELGIRMDMAELEGLAGGGQVGRPHLAQALISRGLAGNYAEAFNRYLGAKAPGYVAKERLSPSKGIELMHAAGGLAVLAHPGLVPVGESELEARCRQMVGEGLDAIEAYYSEHTPAQQQRMLRLAARLGLAASGGSDFHGQAKPGLRLGSGLGALKVPASCLAGLKQRLARRRAEKGVRTTRCG